MAHNLNFNGLRQNIKPQESFSSCVSMCSAACITRGRCCLCLASLYSSLNTCIAASSRFLDGNFVKGSSPQAKTLSRNIMGRIGRQEGQVLERGSVASVYTWRPNSRVLGTGRNASFSRFLVEAAALVVTGYVMTANDSYEKDSLEFSFVKHYINM